MIVCDMCGKKQNEVPYMIAGNNGHICSYCVFVCVKVLYTKTEKVLNAEILKMQKGEGECIDHQD